MHQKHKRRSLCATLWFYFAGTGVPNEKGFPSLSPCNGQGTRIYLHSFMRVTGDSMVQFMSFELDRNISNERKTDIDIEYWLSKQFELKNRLNTNTNIDESYAKRNEVEERS